MRFCTEDMRAVLAECSNKVSWFQGVDHFVFAIQSAASALHNLANNRWYLPLLQNNVVWHLDFGFGQECEAPDEVFRF
jgi:hypothetical protein